MNTKERYIANEDKMFIVSDKVFKIIDSKLVSSNISNIESLRKVNTLEEATTNSSLTTGSQQKIATKTSSEEQVIEVIRFDDKYKTKLRVQTENFWDLFPDHTDREVEFEITNYKHGWFGFYVYNLTTFIDIVLTSYDDDSNKYYILTSYEPSYTFGNWTRDEHKLYICDGWTNSYDPYFMSREIEVSTTACTIFIDD